MNPSSGLSFLDKETETSSNNPFLSSTPPPLRLKELESSAKSSTPRYALAASAASSPSTYGAGASKLSTFSPPISYSYIADLESQLQALIESDRVHATRLSCALRDKDAQSRKWEAEREKLLLRVSNLESEISELSENSRRIKTEASQSKPIVQNDSNAFAKPRHMGPSTMMVMMTKGSPKGGVGGGEHALYLSKLEELNFELDQLMEEKLRISKDYEKAMQQMARLNVENANHVKRLAFYQDRLAVLEREKSQSYDSIKEANRKTQPGVPSFEVGAEATRPLVSHEPPLFSRGQNEMAPVITAVSDMSTHPGPLEREPSLSQHSLATTPQLDQETAAWLPSSDQSTGSSIDPLSRSLVLEKTLSSAPTAASASASILAGSKSLQTSSDALERPALQMLPFAKVLHSTNEDALSQSRLNPSWNSTMASGGCSILARLHPLTVGSWMWKYGPRGVRLDPELLTTKSISKSFYHLRFFWMHPSSATLFWSATDDFANMKKVKFMKIDSVKVLKWSRVKIGTKEHIENGSEAYLVNAPSKKCLYLIPCPSRSDSSH